MTNPTPVPLGISDTVARNVRAELIRRNKNKADLAAHLDIGPEAAANRWNGRTDYSVPELVSIARWLDVAVGVLTAGAAA